jgi:hypothetical protein
MLRLKSSAVHFGLHKWVLQLSSGTVVQFAIRSGAAGVKSCNEIGRRIDDDEVSRARLLMTKWPLTLELPVGVDDLHYQSKLTRN